MRRAFRIAVLGLLAAGLITYLVTRSGLTWSALIHSMAAFSALVFVWIIALTAANLGCVTLKWLLVSRALAPDMGRTAHFSDALLATTFGALLGHVMPFQLGVALARWLAGKLGIGPSAGLSLGATLYEQMFDAIILLVAVVVSAVGLILRPGPMGWAVLVLCSAVLVTSWARFMISPILAMVARCIAWMPPNRVPRTMLELQSALENSAGFSASTLRQLAVLSLLRYATTVAWIAIVLGTLHLWEFAVPIIIGLPLITAIGLVPITPGSLGVTEWTWSAVLLSAGAAIGTAGLFAVTVRIVNIVALLILILFLFSVLLLQRLPMMWRWRAG